jgi:hypothetical protein
MRPCAAVVALAALLPIMGCGTSNDPVEPVAIPCTGTVSISVTAGTTPSFSWTPECLVNEFLVEPTARGIGDRWSFHGTAAPPVRYGVLPAGAQLGRSPEPLIQGTEYRVVLRQGSGASSFLAVRNFTP